LFLSDSILVCAPPKRHHYANPTTVLDHIVRSGLTPRLYRPEEDQDLLQLGYGFSNIVARPSRTAAEITREEYRQGESCCRPKSKSIGHIVCFVGKGVYQEYSGHRDADWGLQSRSIVSGVQDFVAPSSSGLVRMPVDEVTAIYRILTALLE
jgi:TDG/mug DNA glycosylase family protein